MDKMNNDEYFEAIGWGKESDRNYFYALNTKTMQDIMSVAAILSGMCKNTFVGMSIEPKDTSGVLKLRVMGLNNGDTDVKLAGELMELLAKAESTTFIPKGGDMIIEIVFPDLFTKQECE